MKKTPQTAYDCCITDCHECTYYIDNLCNHPYQPPHNIEEGGAEPTEEEEPW